MHIICNQKELANAISIVMKAVKQNTTKEVLKKVYLEAFNKNIRLIGTDLELGIETIIDAEIIEEGEILLDTKTTYDLIRSISSEKIEIKTNERNEMNIKNQNSEFNLLCYDPEEYPELPMLEEEYAYKISRGLFKNMLEQIQFAIDIENDEKPFLTGALVEIEDENINIVSLDGYKMANRKAKIQASSNEKTSFIIPRVTILELIKIINTNLEKDIIIYYDNNDGKVLFDLDNTKIISRLLTGNFIDYKELLNIDTELITKVNTNNFKKAIERALVLVDSSNPLVKLKLENNKMLITSNSEKGNTREVIDIEQSDFELEIGFNGKYLIDILKVIEDEDIKLHFSSSVSPLVIRSIDEPHYYNYLLLPVRIME